MKRVGLLAALCVFAASAAMAATVELPRNPIVNDSPRTHATHDQGWISFANEDYVPLRFGFDRSRMEIQFRRADRGGSGGGYLLNPGQRMTITFKHEVWNIVGDNGRVVRVGAHKRRTTPVRFVGVQRDNRYSTEAIVHDGGRDQGDVIFDFHHRTPDLLPPPYVHGGQYSPPPYDDPGSYNDGYNDGYNSGYQDGGTEQWYNDNNPPPQRYGPPIQIPPPPVYHYGPVVSPGNPFTYRR